MEGGLELKHTCKFCKRNFPCGRSLGGHMRSHMSMVNSSSEPDEKPPLQSNRSLLGFGGGPGYGLRENPKKNWRLSDFVGDASLKRGKLCRECGKGFPSWKSLFGHMSCHPDRSSHTLDQEVEQEEDQVAAATEEEEEECSWSGGAHKPALDGQSDEEITAVMVPRRKRRSRRTAAIASSPSISEIEQELEDVALVLMMLSRDVGFWGGISPITESSDKNSTVLEEEEEKKIAEEGEGGFISARHGMGRLKKLETEKKRSEMGVIRHAFLSNGMKKVESDVSDDGFGIVSRDDELKIPQVYASHHKFQELRKNSSKKKTRHSLSIGELDKRSRGDSEFDKYTSSKKGRFDAYESKLSRGDNQDTAYDAYVGDLGKNPDKKSQFQCTTCNKIFHSYQALGGHRASHKRVKGCSQGKIDGGENSLETDISVDGAAVQEMTDGEIGVEVSLSSSKKVKRHECPICLKVFPSGQALGGHKRSHMVVNSDNGGDATCHQTMVIQQQRPDFLDLNLPAPASEDPNNAGGNVDLKTWWVGSNHKREPLVGLVSN